MDGSEKVGIEESRNLCAQMGTEIPAGGKESERQKLGWREGRVGGWSEGRLV